MRLSHDFYIIESLSNEDINDGKIFFDSLKSTGRFNPVYQGVKNLKEFELALTEFVKSCYKYLFLSAHGDEENLYLLNESVNSYDLFDMNVDLKQRRIFMSSCRGGSFLFAKYFIKKGAYSVVGTPDDLDQIVAVAMWPTMVIVFERLNQNELNFLELDKSLSLMSKVYGINLVYYSFIRNKEKMKEYSYSPFKRRARKNYPI